jgi:acyl-CoA dehydrogenase
MVGGSVSEPSGLTDIALPYEPEENPGSICKVFAHKEGNEWVIKGDKMFCSAGPVAGLIQATVRTDKTGPISKSLSVIWVPKDAPGLSQEVNNTIGGEIVGNSQNHFDNVRVPLSNLIGEVNKGGLVFADIFSAKMIVYVSLFGHARKVYDGLVEYAKERIGGGRPIIQHSHIAQMLGETSVKMDAARALIYKASWESDQRQLAGAPVDLYWSISCFYYLRKVCWDLCQTALEIYGGVGVTPEMPVERFLRRVSTWYITGSVPSMNAIKCSMFHNDHVIESGGVSK